MNFLNIKTLPLNLTLLRVLLIPIFILVYYLPFETARFTAMVIFGFAAFTDWLDGFIARRYNASTPFGAFLDPVADKLIVVVALVMIAVEYQSLIITLATLVIILREVAVSALREWMAQMQQSGLVAVSVIGKYKTTLQLLALGMLIYGGNLLGINWYLIGYIFLILAAFLTLLSMIQYLQAAWPSIKQGAIPETDEQQDK